jgi:hypothetical protein
MGLSSGWHSRRGGDGDDRTDLLASR